MEENKTYKMEFEMKKLYEIYYQEVEENCLSEKIFPFESNEKSEWETPEELMEFLSKENNYQHGEIVEINGDFITFDDGYCVKVGELVG